MKGLAYWGEKTFQELEGLENKESAEITVADFLLNHQEDSRIMDVFKDGLDNDISLATLLQVIGVLDYVYLMPTEQGVLTATWGRDIRVNYRDRYIFVPYYDFEEYELYREKMKSDYKYIHHNRDLRELYIKYNYELKKYILDDRTTNYRRKSIRIYSPKNKTSYLINIDNLVYFNFEEDSFTYGNLGERILYASYINTGSFDLFSEQEGKSLYTDKLTKAQYMRINKSSKTTEGVIRNNIGLPLYKEGTYLDIDYRDYRLYPFDKLFPNYGIFSTLECEQNKLSSPYWYRRYRYEMYVYSIFGEEVSPTTSRESFNKLGKSIRHISYKHKGVTGVLNYYYSGKETKLRRRTYDRYFTDTTGKVY